MKFRPATLQALLALTGYSLICAALFVAAWPSYEAIAHGDKERIAIRRTGLPRSPEQFQWSEWREGSAGLIQGDLVPERLRTARIVAYRVGRATRTDPTTFPYELTFYQARYVYPDGRVEEWAVNGPERLAKAMDTSTASYMLLLASIACFAWRHRMRRSTSG